MVKQIITQERVKELFDYREGKLFWKKLNKYAHRVKVGDRAGALRSDGYRLVRIDRKKYYEHRLVFLYHHGYLPKQLDHINGNPSDNRIENLRESTQSQNQMNATKRRNCSSNYKGVCFDKATNKWRARIALNSKNIYLGRYESEEKAAEVYNKAAKRLFGEFAVLNEV